jgi:restriction system protein
MSDITRRRIGELMRGVFSTLAPHPEGMKAKLVLERLATTVPPTDFEAASYPKNPNVRRYEKIIRFATIGPVKAGWMVKDKGLWSLTDAGRAAYGRFTDPEAFAAESHRLYQQWNAQRPQSDESVDGGESEDTRAATTLEEAEESSWAEIESYLTAMNPYDFQNLVAGLLWGMGYHVAWVAPPGPDGGVDVIAQSDPLGVNGPRIKVQVKRSGRMTVKEIRSFLAVVSDRDVGLFVSAGGFTKDAEDEVRNQEKRRTMLVDLQRLFDLWVEHYEKIPDESRRLLPLRRVWFLAPLP